jgi:hypothetical protein
MKKVKITLLILVIFSGLYSGAWYYMSHVIDQKITQFYYGDAPMKKITLYGTPPRISGFPFQPKITYNGGLEKDGVKIYFKELIVTGFPIPNLPLTLSFPHGINIKNDNNNANLYFDYADVKVTTPKSVPKSGYEYHIKKWQKEVGQIKVVSSKLSSGDTIINSHGTAGLNDNLQLDLSINTRSFGYEEIINFFVSSGTIKPFVGALTLSGMNGMAQIDEASGKKFVDLDFIIKDQQMSFGPIKIATIPPIQWR